MASKKPSFSHIAFVLSGESFSAEILSAQDLPEILAIEQGSHLFPWSLNDFKGSLVNHYCVGLKFQGNWVAYAVMSFVVGEAELLLFVVDRPWQGKGLGGVFLREIIKACSDCAQSVFLEVRASNQAAITLYDSVGFNELGVRKGYYPSSSGKKEDALLLALDLF